MRRGQGLSVGSTRSCVRFFFRIDKLHVFPCGGDPGGLGIGDGCGSNGGIGGQVVDNAIQLAHDGGAVLGGKVKERGNDGLLAGGEVFLGSETVQD